MNGHYDKLCYFIDDKRLFLWRMGQFLSPVYVFCELAPAIYFVLEFLLKYLVLHTEEATKAEGDEEAIWA
jgi:hypothetical protein